MQLYCWIRGEYLTRNSSMPQIINYSSPSSHITMPLSASVGETADGRPNTECNFLSTHYLQNHGLGTRPLEGHLGHSPVFRMICTQIFLVTQVPISLIQKASPGKGMSLPAGFLNSGDFEPFHQEMFPEDKFPRAFFLTFGPILPSSAEGPRSAWPTGFCWDTVLQALRVPYFILAEYRLDRKTRILVPRILF